MICHWLLRKVLEGNYDEEGIILKKTAEIIRRDLLNHTDTNFNGSFSKLCQENATPVSLANLVSMITTGPSINVQNSNSNDVQAMLIRFDTIIRRPEGSTSKYHSKAREPPLLLYTGLLIHAKTRSREFIDTLYGLGLSVSYDRVLEVSKYLSNDACFRFEAVCCVLS